MDESRELTRSRSGGSPVPPLLPRPVIRTNQSGKEWFLKAGGPVNVLADVLLAARRNTGIFTKRYGD
ncbi:MAG: hypothetical protein ACFFD4_14145 [Candidatus Odinarchaeota archaeon]